MIRFDKLPTNTVILIAWALTAHLARNVACAQPQDADQTIEWVVREYPDRVKRLVERLDLGRAELQVVQQAADKNDLVRACRLLLDHYRDGNSAVWLRGGVVRPGDGTDARAELHLNDSFHWHATTGKVPCRDGHLDWSYTGPKNSAEWGYNLNRHYHLDHLLNVYVRTGNPRYASRIDADIRDWVISNPYPARNDARDRPQWRGLEVYFRVIHWAKIFFRLQNDPLLSDATRILILTSVSERADYLRKYHADSGNWITMEMEGLATAGACWLEFRDASAWLSYAVRTTIEQAQTQAYPDGAQKELSYDYHNVALKSLLTTVDTARRGGAELPPDVQHFLENMANYSAYALRPDGRGPMNNDSGHRLARDTVSDLAARFNRPDWSYIATNGERGKQPAEPASRVFPWAGHVVMRNHWASDAEWAFFDVGPWGTGHQHSDKLHLSVHAHGRSILVDTGSFTYRGGTPWRHHAVSSAAHNVILVDGQGQNRGPRTAKAPVTDSVYISPEFVYARGQFDDFAGVDGDVTHTRAVVYLPDKCWIVIDRLESDRTRTISPLWHFAPDCTVEKQDRSIVSIDRDQGNVRIAHDGINLTVEIVSGQTQPTQGWWSRGLGHWTPAPCAVYKGRIDGPATVAWLIVPARGTVPKSVIEIVHQDASAVKVELRIGDGDPRMISIPLDGLPDPEVLRIND